MITVILIAIMLISVTIWGFVQPSGDGFFILYIILLFITLGWELYPARMQTPESGEKIGIITSCHKSGLFIKSNEIHIIKGGMVNGTGNVGTQAEFNVPDKMVTEMQNLMAVNKEVIMEYDCPLFYNMYKYPTGCIVQSIKQR